MFKTTEIAFAKTLASGRMDAASFFVLAVAVTIDVTRLALGK